jgi:hypothetical protein
MSDNRIDSSRISKEGQAFRPAGVAPSWIPPVLKRFYDFTRKMAKSFSAELKEDKQAEREEELVKAVAKSFKGDV